MDNMPTSYPLQPQPPNKKNVPIAVVILLEILFILFLLGSILLALNFFGVLRLNTLFPLSQKNQPASTTIATPTFAYDKLQADGLLTSYIQGTLQPQYILHMYQTDPNYLIQNNNTFYRYWQRGQINVKASVSFVKNSNNPTTTKLFVSMPYTASTSASFKTVATTYLQKYFKTPPASLQCTSSLCQFFTIGMIGAQGMGVQQQGNTISLFSCYMSNAVVATQKVSSCPTNF